MKKFSNIHEAISMEEKPTKEVEIFKNQKFWKLKLKLHNRMNTNGLHVLKKEYHEWRPWLRQYYLETSIQEKLCLQKTEFKNLHARRI